MTSSGAPNTTTIWRNLYCTKWNALRVCHAHHATQIQDSIVTLEIVTFEQVILWPENFYLDGCEKISYMPFDEFQCAEYLENRAFCECVIPQLQNRDLQLDGNCYAEYERYFLFGRRGLAEAVLSDVCANSLRSFIVQIRDFPQCSVADLPNDQEMPYTPFAYALQIRLGPLEGCQVCHACLA